MIILSSSEISLEKEKNKKNQEIINKILELHNGIKLEKSNEIILKFYKN